MSAPPTRCCSPATKGRCSNAPAPYGQSRYIGTVEIAACNHPKHQAALRSLPDFQRRAGVCGADDCGKPAESGLCPEHRQLYRRHGVNIRALLAQEAPMPDPTPTPPAAPQDAAATSAHPRRPRVPWRPRNPHPQRHRPRPCPERHPWRGSPSQTSCQKLPDGRPRRSRRSAAGPARLQRRGILHGSKGRSWLSSPAQSRQQWFSRCGSPVPARAFLPCSAPSAAAASAPPKCPKPRLHA